MGDEPQEVVVHLPPPPIPKARLVIVETVFHQGDGGPTISETRYAAPVFGDEQPDQRPMRVGPQWVSIAKGCRVERPGLVVVSNDEQMEQWGQPTAEQQQAHADKVLEIGVLLPGATAPVACWLVRPKCPHSITGDSHRGRPASLDQLWLRCLGGPCRATVTVYPD